MTGILKWRRSEKSLLISWLKGGLEQVVHYIVPMQRGSLDESACFSTEKPDISHDENLAILVKFVVDSGTVWRTSGNHGTEVCKG